MKESRQNLFFRIVIIASSMAVVACFFISMILIENIAKKDCLNSIEETAIQSAQMFEQTMEHNKEQLDLFADILAKDSILDSSTSVSLYLESFCKTQGFTAACVHKKDGTRISYGSHEHNSEHYSGFENELARAPYISAIYYEGAARSENYIYQAIPITGNGDILGILYGYISLDYLPELISVTAYDGKCEFFLIDGDTGAFIIDEHNRYGQDGTEIPLGNAYTGAPEGLKIKTGYSLDNMRDDVKNAKSDFFIFKSDKTNEWYYMYYTPLKINNWSIQLTIDEPTAFASYRSVSTTMLVFMLCMIVFMAALASVIVIQSMQARKRDNASLHKANYQNAVQGALISAHNNPDFVEQALNIIADEMKAETVLLLTFQDKIVSSAQYWPSKDKTQAMALLGINVRDVFPIFFDALAAKKSIFYDINNSSFAISDTAAMVFENLQVSNIMLVPIMDNTGMLKGAIATVNINENKSTPEMLECVTRDFFMAITNLENHNIIKNMGAMDYLTGLKNRNSYESEILEFETVEAESLWCLYVDVNGLHELNNKEGHKAGDRMLIAVADAMKKIFGKNAYRLGGDEFLAFKLNGTHEELMSIKHRMLDELTRKGYSAAIGFESANKNQNGVFDVEALIAEAEKTMYRDKRSYYEENNLPTQREFNELGIQ